MENRRVATELLKDGKTRYYDADDLRTLWYSDIDINGNIRFLDEDMIPTGDIGVRTTDKEIRIYDRYYNLKGSMQTYGSETYYYDENEIEVGTSHTYKGGITEFTASDNASRKDTADPNKKESDFIKYQDRMDTHYSVGTKVRFRHANVFQWIALVLFAVSLVCSGITPGILLCAVIGALAAFAVFYLDSGQFVKKEHFHPMSVRIGFEVTAVIAVAVMTFLKYKLNSWLYQNYYNNRLSVIVLSLTIPALIGSAVYKLIDRNKKD